MDGTNEADAAPPTETAAAAANHGEEAAPEQTTSVEPSQVSDEEVKQRLLVLLGKSDLTSTTGTSTGVRGWLTAADARGHTAPDGNSCNVTCRENAQKAAGEGAWYGAVQQEGLDTQRGRPLDC